MGKQALIENSITTVNSTIHGIHRYLRKTTAFSNDFVYWTPSIVHLLPVDDPRLCFFN